LTYFLFLANASTLASRFSPYSVAYPAASKTYFISELVFNSELFEPLELSDLLLPPTIPIHKNSTNTIELIVIFR
jgi:hypothetical protein